VERDVSRENCARCRETFPANPSTIFPRVKLMKLNQQPQNIGPQPTFFLKLLRMENIRLTLQQLQCPFAESEAVALLADVTWMDLIAWLLRNYDLNMYENLSKKTFGSAEPSREQRTQHAVHRAQKSFHRFSRLHRVFLNDNIRQIYIFILEKDELMR
jgi:hypothetical protein